MLFFFFNDTATTEIYTLSLHDALPISRFQQESASRRNVATAPGRPCRFLLKRFAYAFLRRSEEHTSELQSQSNLVCRLLLEKKNINDAEIIAEASVIASLLDR